MVTKLTTVAPAPPGTVPALWLRFLSDVLGGDEELVGLLQRAAGYGLTGLTTEHKLLFLFGTGRNGKSTFLNVLLRLWGAYARRVPASTLLSSPGGHTEHATHLAGLAGTRLAVASELPKGRTWDEAIVKDLTGGDRMTARLMRQDYFDFDPQLTLMIAGNNRPSFRGVDEAIRARVVLVPFTVTIPPDERDHDLTAKLIAEGPAILRWAIDGALEWQRRGLAVPASVAAASAEYMDDEDILGRFLGDRTSLDPDGFELTTDLHNSFRFWCDGEGLNPWTRNTFRKELIGRGFEAAVRNHGRGHRGLRLNRE
jgi:P4 family phage/plasmid primase-like protien